MSDDFISEVQNRLEAVLPRVDSGTICKDCKRHIFMTDTLVLVLSRDGKDYSMPVDRETWLMNKCDRDDAAVEKLIRAILPQE